MQYDAQTPEEYIEMLDDDWRRGKIEELRTLIKAKSPDLKEFINYKMLGYQNERGVIFHLNAQKYHVGLYVGDAKKIDPTGELLAGIEAGKGCVRIKKSTSISDTRIAEFIEKTIEMRQNGEDIDC